MPLATFQTEVIDRFLIPSHQGQRNYAQYLQLSGDERSGDEANAVDQQFTRYLLEWLGFTPSEWKYNQQHEQNRPDYTIQAGVGVAFIVEDKNSSLDLEEKHLEQMRRYSVGTAGYALWCNMRRILAVRFLPNESARYETITDVNVEALFGIQQVIEDERQRQESNLALFELLFRKERFTAFADLAAKIGVPEAEFLVTAQRLTTHEALTSFISDSRESLEHLRLAALARIRETLKRNAENEAQEQALRQEWQDEKHLLVTSVLHNQQVVEDAFAALTVGEATIPELQTIEAAVNAARGTMTLPALMRGHYERWLERAERINFVYRTLRFQKVTALRVAEAYRTWGLRQREPEDIRPEIFAEQVAYVFFVRVLLVRVLEDKKVLTPRIASNGGFGDWFRYLQTHFQELDNVSILNDNYYSLLARKAGTYYIHFFQQPVFDWFVPDDYLMLETLEFLCRYNFQNVASDVIGFTYEEYIERRARARKGHFLTRPGVVDYMLDLLKYDNPEVIGRSVLDPACGSGSFLVHAARRYRRACIIALCRQNNFPEEEEGEKRLNSDPTLRLELARLFVEGVTTHFFGMEINPFVCYLAEMNLLIQALDDLSVLNAGREGFAIDRFHIYNTNSLEMPPEVLEGITLTTPAPDRLSDRLADEAYPIKARLDGFQSGFHYLIFNPPYVSGKREPMNLARLRATDFFSAALSGDTNLYLLFLRLAAYYLSNYGRMVFIIPLTIFGDSSSRAARQLMRTAPLAPSAAIRFYRGDILFPGVDQAVGVLRIEKSRSVQKILVGGGNTVAEVRANSFETPLAEVIDAAPANGLWNGAWLVSSDEESQRIWNHARAVSANPANTLGSLLIAAFQDRQGDVNANTLNPLRVGSTGSYSAGHVAIYKGENVDAFSPLPSVPADWASPQATTQNDSTIHRILRQIAAMSGEESGIVRREVARLNTRERLIATWFTRTSQQPLAFTHETWRYVLRADSSEEEGKALLALLNSKTIAYLLNLFSSNNHVGKEELNRIPIPPSATLPTRKLALLADALLTTRRTLETDFAARYQALLPETESEAVYIPPTSVLATLALPKATVGAFRMRGDISLTGSATRRVSVLQNRGLFSPRRSDGEPIFPEFAAVVRLFFAEASRTNLTAQQIDNWLLPEPDAAPDFLRRYDAIVAEANKHWRKFNARLQRIDFVVARWYGFDAPLRSAIAAGLPWARRRNRAASAPFQATSVEIPDFFVVRATVASSVLAAIGYDAEREILEVEMQSGTVYRYRNVPASIHDTFVQAESKGAFYNESIQGKYVSERIAE